MKLKIKIKLFDKDCMPQVNEKGDWFDLKSAIGFSMKDRKTVLIKLGVAMKLPDGYEAIVAPRSSTFKNYSLIQTNGIGVIDNSYCGNGDEWGMPVICLQEARSYDEKHVPEEVEKYEKKWVKCEYGEFVNIPIYSRIAQFRIQLSQKATIWQKIKNLFYSGVEFEVVDNLTSPNRGGFGSTGK